MEQLGAHQQIVVEEFGRFFPVGANSSHSGSQVNDHIDGSRAAVIAQATGIGQQLADGVYISKVIVIAAGNDDFGGIVRFQLFNNVGTQETSSAGDNDSFVLPVMSLICSHTSFFL